MKSSKLFTLLLLVLISSCIYESSVPLDKATMKINKEYLGLWKGSGSSDTYTLTVYTDYIYKLKIHSKLYSENQVMFGYLSDINGNTFLNAWDSVPNSEAVKYSFFKLEKIDHNQIKVFPVTENIKEQFRTSKELRDYFIKNMNNSYFYESAEVCVRSN